MILIYVDFEITYSICPKEIVIYLEILLQNKAKYTILFEYLALIWVLHNTLHVFQWFSATNLAKQVIISSPKALNATDQFQDPKKPVHPDTCL